MARPLRISYPGAFYHVISRGNERRDIFKSRSDREKFLSYLESATRRYSARIHAYCLMGNHYHLLMETPDGNLSQIMHHINGAYTTYSNTKLQKVGHLFQGRYKAILVDRDEYAKELSRYIHLNPVRSNAVDTPEAYDWSSYPYFIGGEKAPEWLILDFILGYFGENISDAQKDYRQFVNDGIEMEDKSPLDNVTGSTILGSVDFVNEIKDKYLKDKKGDRNLPALKEFSDRPAIEDIEKEVESVFGTDNSLSKKVKLYFCHKYSGKKLKEIGAHFGISESGVSQSSHRISSMLQADKKLSEQIALIGKRL